MREAESAIDPTDTPTTRLSMCEREITLLTTIIRQSLEDADALGRRKRMTGEHEHCRDVDPEAVRQRHMIELRAWMRRPASSGLYSLAYICDRLAAVTGHRLEPAPICAAIELALAGQTPPGLLHWRSLNVSAVGATGSGVRNYERERSRRRVRMQRRAEAEVRA